MSPNSLNPRSGYAYRRRARLSRNLGLAAMPVAGAALVDRALLGTSSAGATLAGPIDTLWLVAYLAGGAACFAGAAWRPYPRPELEALGCWLLCGSMAINGLAILYLRGPVAGGLTSIGLFAIADALHARAQDLEEARMRERRRRPTHHPRPHGAVERRRT